MFVKTEDGGKKDVEITAVTKDNYIVPDKEKHLWHVTMEIPTFDPKNGKRISRPKLQKFGAKTFHALRESWEKQGYTITVLYDPTAYLDELKAKGTTVQRAARQAEIDAIVAKKIAEKEAEMEQRISAAVEKALAEKQGTKKKSVTTTF